MRKLLISIMFLFGGALTMVSAQDMRTVFLNAPDGIFPLLSGNDRADLVDYIEAGMTAKVTNRLDGTTVLHELENDYLKLATTASSDVQLKLLPFQGDTVICMIKTVKAEAADSRIRFYDKEWNLLDGDRMFRSPSIAEFFTSAVDELVNKCDIDLVSLTLSATDNTLAAEYTMPAYMIEDDAKKVKPMLRKLVYRWNGSCYVIE